MSHLEQITAIATTTFYKPGSENDAMRAELAKSTIRKATDLGYGVVVVDGGSSDELLREFERYGAQVFLEKSMNMGQSRRHAIERARNLGREVVAWTEPEKDSYIPELYKTVEAVILGHGADIVVPRRHSLESYPVVQQHAEQLGNSFWKELTGHDLDVWVGPRTFTRDAAEYFLNYNGEYGDKWDSIFIPVMDAIIDGKNVKSVTIEYTHPRQQTALEEHDLTLYWKRLEQLQNLLGALEKHWKKRNPA
ncbi:MAG: hypothetical protein KJ955_06935 [Nanoarchaeota archaeon]|nr:hypothetical protein [Nanoarchaeota archaeon]